MKKKNKLILVVVIIALIAVVAFVIMRLFGGGAGGIDNEPEQDVDGKSNVLVAYFSWSGNGQQMARWISDETGADLFRIVPEEAYAEEYSECTDRWSTP